MQSKTLFYSVLLIILLVFTVFNANTTPAASSTVTARLSGASEVPVVLSSGSGTLTASFDRRTRVLKWAISYSGLSEPLTATHFHGPALAGENAEVAVAVSGNLASPINGSTTLTATEMDELLAGKWYVNLHTATHPKGEIRGQLAVRP
ncbi:MAG: CHRD domain-containing protein [Xanthomonadaceae bacterium]|nr:CHRD domain-containing protein [Xanthomonadaceae bacterium]